jgi:flagellar protein FlaG
MDINTIPTNKTSISTDASSAVSPAKSEVLIDHSTKNSASHTQDISMEAVQKAAEKVNKVLVGTPMKFEYTTHKSSSVIAIKMVNSETNEVIRQIPSEQFFDLVDKLPEISGAILDEKG